MAGRESQQLPTKEAGLFRQVVKFYESKQYKKGLKAAEQILKKQPEHGETLAMKGLILSYQEKKAEAYDFVRRGLKADLKSHVCWHVYGLLWRADNNYDEAIKCYKNALRIDKENIQILRDLALLQIQMRDYTGFIDTRKTLLHLKASNRNNWISFVIAHHLNKDYDLAVQILSGFESTQDGIPKGEEYEHSEMLLYKAMILEEGGQYARALSHLEGCMTDLKDLLGYEETRGRLLLKLKRMADAEATYRRLLELNPDNYRYHNGLWEAIGLEHSSGQTRSEAQQQQLGQLYKDLAEKYPKSNGPRRIPLDFLEGEAFADALDAYVRKFLQKGVPSLFSDLKGLYGSPEKVAAIEHLFERLLAELKEDSAVLPPRKGETGKQEPAGEALLWTKVFLARHYDKLEHTERALGLIEQCIEDEPELVDLYSVKSRILKHAGDLEGAAAAAFRAQSLDRADRYLNSMAAKALFRAGHVEAAEKMAALFTKDSDQPNLLYEMQCMWYEIECGSAYLRRRDFGRALKNFLAVTKHFATFQEDQFDFHGYCIRKMTLRAYVNMLRMEDGILENTFYAQAAWGAIEAYIELANAPAAEQQSLEKEEALLASMSLDDRKKHKLKKKKDAQKKAKEEERKVQEAAAAAAREKEAAKSASKKQAEKGRDKEKEKEKDPDPDGVQLAAVEDPLAEAAKLLRLLREQAGRHLRTHLLGFEVAMRQGKHLLALQAVKRGAALAGAAHPNVHRIIVRFCKQVLPHTEGKQNGSAKAAAPSAPEVVQEVISSYVDKLLGGVSLDAFNKAYSQAEGATSLLHRAAAAEMQALLHPEQKATALHLLLEGGGPLGCEFEADQLALADCVEVHKLLEERLSEPEAAQTWFKRCQELFPYSAHFLSKKRTASFEHDSLQLANGVKPPAKKA